MRIMLDESMSFGVLGATGRGITEHFGVCVSSPFRSLSENSFALNFKNIFMTTVCMCVIDMCVCVCVCMHVCVCVHGGGGGKCVHLCVVVEGYLHV